VDPRIGEGVSMTSFKNILFPIDFSECSIGVFPHAVDMARHFDARLHLLFVARDISYLGAIDVPSEMLMDTVAVVVRAAENQMQRLCETHLRDFPDYESKVVVGNPGEEIVKFAEEQGIKLIVMGTHGRKGLDRIIMGSVADYVVKNAAMPVLTLKPSTAQVRYVSS
jgi:nucleotide-binding universal stress UspA family protein